VTYIVTTASGLAGSSTTASDSHSALTCREQTHRDHLLQILRAWHADDRSGPGRDGRSLLVTPRTAPLCQGPDGRKEGGSAAQCSLCYLSASAIRLVRQRRRLNRTQPSLAFGYTHHPPHGYPQFTEDSTMVLRVLSMSASSSSNSSQVR
jgi:hypothetical protein